MSAPAFTGLHADFLADQTPEIDLEGGRGSGKTWVCIAKVIESCLRNPGIHWLICRYSGTETETKLRPIFTDLCERYGQFPKWDDKLSYYEFENGSRVFAHGLKSQAAAERKAKLRGAAFAGVYNDQTEETPQDISEEIRFALRQPGYPHQLIFSPNPPDEDHYLTDQFVEDNSIPDRKYMRLSLYDNPHTNKKDLETYERTYPPTHPHYRSLILGLRGPSAFGEPVYKEAFNRELHFKPVAFDPELPLLEAFDAGKHHPTWVAAQRSPFGSLRLLGGIMGKRIFLESFLPIVSAYRQEWFPDAKVMTCSDPPPSHMAFTHTTILKESGLTLRWQPNSNAPDVRESVIQYLGGQMQRRFASEQSFAIHNDPTRWKMASTEIVKNTRLFIDGCEGSYVWEDNLVSVGNKKVQQPRYNQWLEGWQRCLENIALNFCAGKETAKQKAHREQDEVRAARASAGHRPVSGPFAGLI